MRKFNFAKIISFVFICAVLVGALAIAAFATEETPTVEIAAHNVYYGDSFHIMYAVKAPAGATITAVDTEGNDVKVVPFKDPDSGATTVTLNGVVYDMYITEVGVAAQALDEVITLTVKAGDEVATNAYSVLQYTYERKQDIADSTEDADVKELAMLNALVEYADAANAFMPEEDEVVVPFGSYVYVTVEGATVNGVNPTGMYAAGATPFANLELALDYDEANQTLRWYADDVLTDLDAIKAIVVADKNIAVKAVVLDKSFDGHTMIAPTCQKDGYCDVCGAAGDPKVDHKDENGDYKCDYDCGTNVLPAADSVLTIEQAIAIGNLLANDEYTTNSYYVTGRITSVESTTYGNLYIVDENNNTFYTYGSYDADGTNRYDAMAVKPVVGDTITLYGAIGNYYTGPQMKNAWITAHTAHECAFSDATCDTPATCTLCGATSGEALEHNDADGDGLCDKCGESASVVTETVKYTFGTITGTQYADETQTINDKISISTHNGGCHFTTQLRLYDSTTNNGWAIITSTVAIDELVINMGYKKATLEVYGSKDGGVTWELIQSVATTSTSYLDYIVAVGADNGYTQIKIDAVGAQLRIASIQITTKG